MKRTRNLGLALVASVAISAVLGYAADPPAPAKTTITTDVCDTAGVRSASAGAEISVLPVRYKRAPQVAQTINQVVEMIAQDESQNTIKGTLRVVADEETNVLFVYTRKSNVVFVTSLLTVLDVVTAPDSVAKAVHLQHAKATHVKDILGQLIGNRPAGGSQITIVADDRTNMLMILATKADIEALEKFIQPFDVDSADSAAAATSASCATTNRPLEKDSGQPGVGR